MLVQPVWRCQAGVYKENPCPTFQGFPSSGLLKTSRDQEQVLQSPSRPCVMILVLVQSKQALRPSGVKNILRAGLLHGAAGLCPLLFLSFLSLLLRRGGFWRHLWLCLWPPDRCEIGCPLTCALLEAKPGVPFFPRQNPTQFCQATGQDRVTQTLW